MAGGIRLNRYLAQCGLGARRKCDEIVRSGHIFINGAKVTELGTRVMPGDKVVWRGRELKNLQRPEYFAYHKPAQIMVTRSDPEGRPTLYDALRDTGFNADHLNYVGRLDFQSEGLLILTNDGELIHAVTHPRYRIRKTYRLDIDRPLADDDIVRLREGVESEGQLLRAGAVRRVGRSGCCYDVDLYEGKNRQLRRMFDVIGYRIFRLLRTKFAAVRLADLPAGAVRPLTPGEITALKNTGFIRGKQAA